MHAVFQMMAKIFGKLKIFQDGKTGSLFIHKFHSALRMDVMSLCICMLSRVDTKEFKRGGRFLFDHSLNAKGVVIILMVLYGG